MNKYKDRILLSILLILLFFHWVDIKIIAFILIALSFKTLLDFRKKLSLEEKKFYKYCVLISVFTILVSIFIYLDYQFLFNFKRILNGDVLYKDKNISLRIILVYLNPCLIVFSLLSFRELIIKNIKKIALSFFLITTLTIIIEFIARNFFGLPGEFIPTYRESLYYNLPYLGIYRPWGLTGNPAFNGGLVVLALILLDQLKMINWKIMLLFLISNVLTISGQSLIMGIVYVDYLFLKGNYTNFSLKSKLFLTLLFTSIIYIVSLPVVGQKISPVYIYTVIKNGLGISDLTNLDFKYWLFGSWGINPNNIQKASEIFYVYQIREFGLVFSMFYYLIPLYFIRNTKNPFFNFVVLVISNLHYPLFMAFEAQLLLIMIYFSTKIPNENLLSPRNTKLSLN